MWDVLVRAPRGSNNSRKFSMLLATFFVALLGYSFTASTPVSAVSGSWDGDNISYDGNAFLPYPSDATLPSGISEDQSVYHYIDTSKTPRLIYFIAFPAGVNPQSEKEATYVRYTMNPPNRFVNPSDEKTISLTPAANGGATTDDGEIGQSCTVSGIGWIVCPIMNGISEGMDLVYKAISGYLVVQPISTTVDNPIYRIWVYSRDIANIAFVIGFLVIIYSYIVGGGFSGYEIRKILPRLVIAAILINLSYILSAVAVDVSNIAGSSINQLFETVRDDVLAGSTGDSSGEINWTSVTTWVLAGGVGAAAGATILPGAIGGAAAGLWFLLAPFLLGAALLVMVTFLILAARQAIIVVLIAIAPIACAAFILPNTEKWFHRWRDTFFTMLIMFPAFGAVFGASQLAGELIIRMAKANGSIEQIILGLGVMVAPLAVTPLLLKLGGGVLNRFGGVINNSQKGVYDRFKNYNNERRADFLANQQQKNAMRDENGNLINTGFMRRAAYRQDYKKNNRQRMRDANLASAKELYDADDNGIETVRSKVGRRYANARGRDYDPTYKYGSQEIADLSHRTDLLKNYTHGRRDDHWQHELQSDAGLRTMLTDTRDFEGRAAIRSEAMKAEDDRTFQTNLDTNAVYANLRDMKVNTIVDSGVADVHKSAVDAAGKLALSTAVTNSPELRTIKSRTFANEKSADTLDTIIKTTAERDYTRSSDGQRLNIRSQVAQDELDYTKAAETARIQELRTKKAAEAGLTPSEAALANALRDADYQKRIETQRGAAAKRQSDVEYAVDVTEVDDNGNPTAAALAIANRAGGIEGSAGVTQARATAFKTIVDAQNAGTAAASLLLSRVDNDVLLGDGPNGLSAADILERPTEQISAIGSTIASRMHQKSHILLWERMSELKQEANRQLKAANDSGDADRIADAKDKIGKVKDLQQQVMGDKKRNPFGAGDYDQGKLNVGEYEGNIYESTRQRILTHMSGKRLSETDPDDLRLIFEMARAGKLGDEHLAKLAKAYEEWKTDKNLKSSIEDKHRFLLDPLEQYAQTHDRNVMPDPTDPAPEGASPTYWRVAYEDLDSKMSNP